VEAPAAGSIATDRLILERWQPRHLDDFCAMAADARVVRYVGSGRPWTPAESAATFQTALEHWGRQGFGWRAALEAGSGRWIGFAGLNLVGPGTAGVAADEVEIGWWLVPSAWGRGYATEAGRALRDEAFERVRLARIVGRYRPENVASGRVMERLGMRVAFDTRGRHGEDVRLYELDHAGWELLRAEEAARPPGAR
jgi:[ribosomal protein S5]-alanine N-acetyltransferase